MIAEKTKNKTRRQKREVNNYDERHFLCHDDEISLIAFDIVMSM